MKRKRWLLFEKDPDGGGGGGDPQDKDPQKGLENLIKRAGSLDAAGMLLYQDNFNLRDQLREVKAEMAKLQAKLPKEGDLVLIGDEKALYEKYKALGKPEDWEKERNDAKTMKRNQVLSEAAAVYGYVPSVLQRLAADGLEIEIREIDKDGQKQKVAMIKGQDGEKSLPDYAKAQWSEFLPALEKKAEQQKSAGVPPTPTPAGNIPKATEEQATQRKAELNQQIRSWM